MVEHTPFGPQDPDFNSLNEDLHDGGLGASRRRRYALGRSAKDDFAQDESVPLFLSDPDGEPEPSEYDYADVELPRRRMSISLRILMAVVAAAGVAMMFAMATSDATRDVIVSAKASLSGMQPLPAEAAQAATPPEPITTNLTTSDVQAKDLARWAAPTATDTRGPVVAMTPPRDEVSSTYQNAMQSHAAPPVPVATTSTAALPVAAAPAIAAPAPPRVVDADELALLMKRAKEMLSTGDLPSARLLLRRAADAQEPAAALMLAQTYDPDVLGTQDARNIIPDPEAARFWYQKAAQLGSRDAQRRLAQLQN